MASGCGVGASQPPLSLRDHVTASGAPSGTHPLYSRLVAGLGQLGTLDVAALEGEGIRPCLSVCLLPAPPQHRCESAQVRKLTHLPCLALEKVLLSLPVGLEENLNLTVTLRRDCREGGTGHGSRT